MDALKHCVAGLLLLAIAAAPCDAFPSQKIINDSGTSTGYVQLASLGSAIGFTLPAGSQWCIVIPEGAPIRYRVDGTNPTAAIGVPLVVNQPVIFRFSAAQFAAVKFIQQSVGGIANIDCYKDD